MCRFGCPKRGRSAPVADACPHPLGDDLLDVAGTSLYKGVERDVLNAMLEPAAT